MRLDHAVVLGGSVAGLCAAAALAGCADRVTLLERDVFPDAVAPRRGVPQSRHVHALLQRGRDEMNALFPGFDAAMLARAVPELDYGLDYVTLRPAGWAGRMPTGITALYPSRDCIDAVLRALLVERGGVTIEPGVRAVGLVADGPRARAVRGVRVRAADAGPAGAPRIIHADLVVDATGRGSEAPAWLRALGRRAPDEQRVDARATYASRWYRMAAAGAERWWKAAWIDPLPPDRPWGGVMFPTEGGRAVVTIAGYNGAPMPADASAFEEFLRTGLRSPVIARSLEGAEPISEVAFSRSTSNQWRRWEQLARPIAGLVVTGDAACAFNPVYGQGMSVAAACARMLRDEVLESARPSALPAAFHARQGRFLRSVWDIAAGADALWPATVGHRAIAPRLLAPYMEALGSAMLVDERLARRVLRVFHLVDDASALFGPEVLAKVALDAARRAMAPRPSPPALPPPELARILPS